MAIFRSSTVSSLAAVAFLLFNSVSADDLPGIEIKGNKFFFSNNGSEFYIKGLAYQQGLSASTDSTSGSDAVDKKFTDPLADITSCKRDIASMQELGINTIRTYALDPTKDHDKCMSALNDAGIYLITDLSEPSTSIIQTDPTWDTTLFDRYTSVIDAMSKYDNTLGFFAGNEVMNNVTNTNAAAFVKAAVRDCKAYIKQKSYRAMGVGYAADDDATVRSQNADYLNCGSTDESIDFWGYNIYEWCGNSTFEKSGYDHRVEEFKNYSVPSFFAEYGCNTAGGGKTRPFTEVAAIYGDQMTDTFSGAIAFEWFEGDNDFGLVSADGNSLSTFEAYSNLQTQLASATPTSVNSASFSPTNTAARDCPSVSASYWQAAASPLPPTPDKDVCTCMVSSLKCRVKSDIDSDAVGVLFGQVCGYNDGKPCASGINQDTTKGSYGAFSMCNSTEKLSFAVNQYYNEQGSSDACDFGGNATLVSNPSSASTCSSLISSATAAASGSSTGKSSTTGKKSDAAIVGPSLGVAKYWVGGYVATVFLSVAGIWFL